MHDPIFSSKPFLNDDFNEQTFQCSVLEEICVEMLKEGYVEGFENFFYLTHEKSGNKFIEKPVLPDVAAEKQKALQDLDEDGFSKRRLYTHNELNTICNIWKSVEYAKENKDYESIYKGFKELGSKFESMGDYENALKHHEKAFEYSNLTGLPEHKVEAHLLVGSAKQNIDAIRSFETARRLCQTYRVLELEYESCKRVVDARILKAKKMCHENKCKEAITHYMETINIIQESCPNDNSMMYNVHYNLGNAFHANKEYEQAIASYESYLQHSRDLNDVAAAGQAHASIASCFEALGNREVAIEHLEGFCKLAETQNDMQSMIEAYRHLGEMFNSQSLNYYRKYYDTVMSNSPTINEANIARCQLGIAKSQDIVLATGSPQNLRNLLTFKLIE
ncbi:TPR-like protein [Rozella allomycis CSF55]|uniref:Tetratricopeptide repeat protein 29 n=1 Tax=Rozella allomycis (strain CSF55) TaxID=988480 RepID=A0A4P9YQ18_ROZAC|nr:TPR-like protein [Rozella allomycis CSF55]